MAADPTTNRATWRNMQTKLQAMGGITAVVIGEPKSRVQSGLVSILPMGGSINGTNLQGAHEAHRVSIRRYENAIATPEEDTEFRLDAWRATIFADVFGEFDLGGTIAYPLPLECSWEYGYATVENTLYRFLDVILVYQVFDRATFAA